MRFEPGDRIGAYRVRAPVDATDMAAVLQVDHVVLDSAHALKILLENDQDAFARALHHGARLQAQFDHPHVVRCTDAGEHDGLPWVVTDWMNGGTLAELLDHRGGLPLPFALRLFRGVTRGLRVIHGGNVVHRDLKPQNVLFAMSGQRRSPKINDLHFAKALDHTTEHETDATLSMEFRTIGTPEYMAPEQAADPARVDFRADLYSLGVTLYEMLTNEVPYDFDESWRTLVAARLGKFRPIRELRADCPPEVEALVADLLKPEPDHRPATCEVVLARLDGLADASADPDP